MAIDQRKLWSKFRWAGEYVSYRFLVEPDGKVGIQGLIPPQPLAEWSRELGRASHMAHRIKDMVREHKITKGELLLTNMLMMLEALHEATEAENIRQPLLGLLDALTHLIDSGLQFECPVCASEDAKPNDGPQVKVKIVEVRSPQEFAALLQKLQEFSRDREDPPFPPPSGTLN